MLPPMKPVEKPSGSRFDFRKWSEKEQPVVVNPVSINSSLP